MSKVFNATFDGQVLKPDLQEDLSDLKPQTRYRISLDGTVGEGNDTVPNVRRTHAEVIEEIWTRQKARGYTPPTKEQVDAYIQAERDSWDD